MSQAILQRLLQPLTNRVKLMVARAVVQLVNDTPALQELQIQVLKGETRDRVERFQEYGFSSQPLPPDAAGAAEAAVVFVGGIREHALVVAVDDRRYRLQIAAGEVALYDDQGSKVHLKRNDEIEVTAAGKVTTTAGTAKVEVNGSTNIITVDAGPGLSKAEFKDDRVEITAGVAVKASILPTGIILEESASNQIAITAAGITFTGVAYTFN